MNKKKRVGIYYLVDYVEGGVVVLYVGGTKDVGRKIREHKRNQDIVFCDVYFDECKEEEMEGRKAEAIAEFWPLLNGRKSDLTSRGE